MIPTLIIAAAAAAGQTAGTADLLIRLTVVPTCAIHSAEASTTAVIDFGQVGSASAPIVSKVDPESTKALTLRCSSSFTTPMIALSAGTHGMGAQRYLTNGSVRVGYELFRDAALSEPWRPAVPYPITVRSTSTAEPIGIYGRVPAPQQATAPGTYADTVLVTLSY